MNDASLDRLLKSANNEDKVQSPSPKKKAKNKIRNEAVGKFNFKKNSEVATIIYTGLPSINLMKKNKKKMYQ